MLNRMFFYLTLAVYLTVGTMAVRVFMPTMTTVSVSSNYLSLFSNTTVNSEETDTVSAPEMHFAEIKFPVEKKPVIKRIAVVKKVAPKIVQKPVTVEIVKVAKNELPFYEPIVLQKIEMNHELEGNLVALYQGFSYSEAIASNAPVEDVVSTKMAQAEAPLTHEDAEPTFFEYEEEKVAEAPKPIEEQKVIEPQVVENKTEAPAIHVAEEVAVQDLVAFDYSKATQDIKNDTVPVVSNVTTQPKLPEAATTWTVKEKKSSKKASKKTPAPEMNRLLADKSQKSVQDSIRYPSRVTIQIVSTDLKKSAQEVGFEVRTQDDLSESHQDYNSGSVTLDQELAAPKMTRSVAVLKHGFAPTNTEIILEEGVSEISLPMIEEGTFNEMMAPFESRGPMGAVLVELDDETENATLDVPYSQVLHLDGDLKVTESGDYRYQLFVGVKVGNALLGYKDNRGEVVSKIIHIHEREVTFEMNFFENVTDEKVLLFEEDLLGKEKAPLIITSEQVKQFATQKTARKLNDHTYKMNFERILLGTRKYLELNHQAEPVFIGIRENQVVKVPSESFMRYILSRFEGSQLGNRCLVQVNLSKRALKVDVAPESVGQTLMTYTQMLDRDGKFYDSVGDKTEKIIVVGEDQGAPEYAVDSKINFKITYEDGSVQYLGSYCSPNTYLVEQL